MRFLIILTKTKENGEWVEESIDKIRMNIAESNSINPFFQVVLPRAFLLVFCNKRIYSAYSL